jgi:hypothetical protein
MVESERVLNAGLLLLHFVYRRRAGDGRDDYLSSVRHKTASAKHALATDVALVGSRR